MMAICIAPPLESIFPCFDYHYHKPELPSVMEQIAAVKLLHIPMAMSKGKCQHQSSFQTSYFMSRRYTFHPD
jgi:hypothetical protein